MTPRQRDLLRFIESYLRQHDGVSPTFEEMRVALGLAGKGGVAQLLDLLEREGRIVRGGPRRERTISLPPATDWSRISDSELRDEYARRFGGPGA